MPRPKSFEPQRALEQMLQVFWRLGFEATSISDLEAATGLNKRSLYNTFGDKSAIFDQVVEAYGSMMAPAAAALRRDPASVANIRAFFRGLATHRPNGLGCLFTKSVNERDLIEPATFEKVKRGVLALEPEFVRNLKPQVGTRAAKRIAQFLTAAVQGITTMTRVDPELARMRAVVKTIESMLDAECEASDPE